MDNSSTLINNQTFINYTDMHDDISGYNYACAVGNDFTNSSIFGISFAVPVWEALFFLIISLLEWLAIMVLNSFVIISVISFKPLNIPQNYLILSLAIADFSLGFSVLPFSILQYLLGRWVFGMAMCKIWLTIDIIFCTSSIYHICAISIDRLWAVTFPVHYSQERTLKTVVSMIFFVWLISIGISFPPLLGWNDWPKVFNADSNCRLTLEPGFVIFSSLGSFFIPLIWILVVNLFIYFTLNKIFRRRIVSNRNASSESNQSNQSTNEIGLEMVAVGNRNILSRPAQQQKFSLTREQRASRTLRLLVGVFTACWIPFSITYLLITFCHSCCISKRFVNFTTWLGYFNSLLNPLIYTIFNTDFRKAYKKLLCGNP